MNEKIEQIEKNEVLNDYKNTNSVAFISYKTNIERDMILMAYNKTYGGYCSPKPLYSLSPAKEPENIIWDHIGFSRREEIVRYCFVRPLFFLLVPVFIFLFILFNAVFSYLHFFIRAKEMVFILNITLVLVIKAFTFITLKSIDFLNKFELSVRKSEHLARKVFVTAVLKALYLYIGYNFLTIDKEIQQNGKIEGHQSDYRVTDHVLQYL